MIHTPIILIYYKINVHHYSQYSTKMEVPDLLF